MLKKLIFSILFLGTSVLYAQSITNVKAVQSGDNILVHYDLNSASTSQTFSVQLFCSTDGGSNWGDALTAVEGDIGEGVSPGKSRKITWMVLNEKSQLVGSNIRFEVRAQQKESLTTFSGHSLVDKRDSKSYPVIKINGLNWMAENLNYEVSGSCCYNNDDQNCRKYGRLYTWYDAQKSCPEGWRLPTEEEWNGLEVSLGLAQDQTTVTRWRGTNQGEKLKKGGTSGFDALYGGYKSDRGTFDRLGTYSYFWSGTEYNAEVAYCRLLLFSNPAVYLNRYSKQQSMSVRCVKE